VHPFEIGQPPAGRRQHRDGKPVERPHLQDAEPERRRRVGRGVAGAGARDAAEDAQEIVRQQ
jgi:hypothetical protein